MKRSRSFAVAVLALIVLALPARLEAQSGDQKSAPPGRPPKQASGGDVAIGQMRLLGRVNVGEKAPDFGATTASGGRFTIARMRGDWVVLVFASRREDFQSFRPIHDALRQAGAMVYGVCKEKPQRLRATADRDSLPFELLADDTGDISALYGLYDVERRTTSPGFVVVDRYGIVRLALQGVAPPPQVEELTRFTIAGY